MLILFIFFAPMSLRYCWGQSESHADPLLAEDGTIFRNPFLPQLPKKPKKVEKEPEIVSKPKPKVDPKIKPDITSDPKPTPPKPLPIPKPQFDITGIFWNTDRPQAIINGQVVEVGDTVDLFKIESIDPSGIDVSIRGVRMTVKP